MFPPSKFLGPLRSRQGDDSRSEEHTSELQSLRHLVCRLLLEKKKKAMITPNAARGMKALSRPTPLGPSSISRSRARCDKMIRRPGRQARTGSTDAGPHAADSA